MTWYPTQSHYPETEPNSPCPILIMPSTWLGSINFICHCFDSTMGLNPWSPARETSALPIRPLWPVPCLNKLLSTYQHVNDVNFPKVTTTSFKSSSVNSRLVKRYKFRRQAPSDIPSLAIWQTGPTEQHSEKVWRLVGSRDTQSSDFFRWPVRIPTIWKQYWTQLGCDDKIMVRLW